MASCPTVREALSARLDGEPIGMPAQALDQHLAACAACVEWGEAAAVVTRRARLTEAQQVPDLTVAVLTALPRELPGTGAAARSRLLDATVRLALVVTAVAQAGLAWPALATGAAAMSAPVHMAHETGAWNLAIAAAFLAVAVAPLLAVGALPFLATFAALLVPVTVADLAAGYVHADRAVAHLLLLVGVLLVATAAWRSRRRRVPSTVRGLGAPA